MDHMRSICSILAGDEGGIMHHFGKKGVYVTKQLKKKTNKTLCCYKTNNSLSMPFLYTR